MKKIKKMIALLCCISMICSTAVYAAADSNDDGSAASIVTAPGQLPLVNEEVTLSGLVIKNNESADWSVESNEALKYIMQETGVNLKIDAVSRADAATRIQTMFASGDYPDFIWGDGLTQGDLVNYGTKEGFLIPLNDLIEKYGYWYKDALEEVPNANVALTCEDGNLYGIGDIEVSHVTYSAKMWLNYEWLDILGLDVPETTEEFYNVLKAFKNDDPNGNGIADEIPLTGGQGGWRNDPCIFILQAFCPYAYDSGSSSLAEATYLYNDNGTVKTVATMEEYREGLRYMNKLWEEGLLDPAVFAQSNDDLMRVSSGETKVVGAAAGGHLSVITDTSNQENEKPYKALTPLTGPTGRKSAAYFSKDIASMADFAITDKCEYPEVAFRFVDYLFRPETAVINYSGPYGIGIEKLPEDTDLVTADGSRAKVRKLQANEQNIYQNVSIGQPPCFRGYDYNYKWYAVELPREEWNHRETIEAYLNIITKEQYEPYGAKDECVGPLSYTADETAELQRLTNSMNQYLDDARIQFIQGTMDLDNDWDAYVETVENSEMPQIIALTQAAYDRTYK